MELILAKMIVEWACYPGYTVAVAGTAEHWKQDRFDPDCGWDVVFTHN